MDILLKTILVIVFVLGLLYGKFFWNKKQYTFKSEQPDESVMIEYYPDEPEAIEPEEYPEEYPEKYKDRKRNPNQKTRKRKSRMVEFDERIHDINSVTAVRVPIRIENGMVIMQGDILLGSEKDLKTGRSNEALVKKPRYWKSGIIPYTIDSSINRRSRILNAINEINSNANAQFIERTNEKDYVTFRRGEKHCYSYVGRIGKQQWISLEPACRTGQILHELMHTLGFFHEQSRWDRDEYLNVNWGNIDKKYHPQYLKLPPKFININLVPFDFESILLYGPTLFSKNKHQPTMTTKAGELYYPNTYRLSAWDITRINEVYESRI